MSGAETADFGYMSRPRGPMSWLVTLDHKRIAILYLFTIMTTFALGGFFAMLMRTEHLTPKHTFMNAETYDRVFTLHGAIMIFLFLIPSMPAIFGNFMLPIMLGAKDLAFPKMNLASYYIYVFGALFAIITILAGGVDTGWTFYTPYSTATTSAVIPMVAGIFILGFSSIFTGLNFIVTIHKMRPPGMTWFRMPLFLWSMYATSVIQILATPVLAITLLLLAAERVFKIGFFDPALGGDPLLFQHFFWFYSHPAVYIMILPAMGIVSEVIPTFSRKPIFGYNAIAFSSLGIAFIGFLVWGHHMFVSGQSNISDAIFSALTYAVAVPSAIKIFNWTATMYKGSISLDTPMCYALSFIFLFAIGGLTGVVLGSLATNVTLHDTYFVVAHFHYTMVGGAVMGFLAGLHYWWPKMFGRRYSETWGRIACALIFVGFNTTFFTMFVMGSKGLPRRYWSYPPRFEGLNQLATVGSYVMLVGFLIMAVYLFHSLFRGKRASDNPWGSATLEWQTTSPPPTHNFEKTPAVVRGPYDYTGIEYDADSDGYSFK